MPALPLRTAAALALGDATCIAMAGARYTGKTVYIAVLIGSSKFLEAVDTEVTPPTR